MTVKQVDEGANPARVQGVLGWNVGGQRLFVHARHNTDAFAERNKILLRCQFAIKDDFCCPLFRSRFRCFDRR